MIYLLMLVGALLMVAGALTFRHAHDLEVEHHDRFGQWLTPWGRWLHRHRTHAFRCR